MVKRRTTTPFSAQRRGRGRQRVAFSLIEVAMAIAITSFACVTIMAIIPSGLSSFRQAMNNTVESEIVQATVNDVSLTAFTNLAAVAAPMTNYYDSEGVRTNSANALYAATVTFTDLSANAGASNPMAGLTNWAGTTARIQIVKQGQNHTNYYSIILGNNQSDTNAANPATWQ